MEYHFERLDERASAEITELFVSVFTNDPWNDDWSDQDQLARYIHDLIGQGNSLTFGLYEGPALIGLSMGRVKHGYAGAEYDVDELCIRASKQGQGVGRRFMEEIERACRELGLRYVFLLTDDDVPAFAFYRKMGYSQLKNNVAFAKKL
jgi:aminoglycoside 6'-N-acetyltransferase I